MRSYGATETFPGLSARKVSKKDNFVGSNLVQQRPPLPDCWYPYQHILPPVNKQKIINPFASAPIGDFQKLFEDNNFILPSNLKKALPRIQQFLNERGIKKDSAKINLFSRGEFSNVYILSNQDNEPVEVVSLRTRNQIKRFEKAKA